MARRALLAVWLALQLLLAQQLALAHRLEHIADALAAPGTGTVSRAQDGEEDESAAHVLSHVCTTCIACLGADSGAPLRAPITLALATGPAPLPVAVVPAPTFHRPPAFRSRAPPLLQD